MAANAAAVSANKLAKRRVGVSPGQFHHVPARDLAAALGLAGSRVVGAATKLEGELRGALLVAMEEATARALSDILLDRPEGACQKLGPLEESSLKELANILAGGYSRAYTHFLSLKVDWGVPLLAMAGWEPLLKYTFLGTAPGSTEVWAIASRLHVGAPQPIHLILLVDPASRGAIVRGVQRRLAR